MKTKKILVSIFCAASFCAAPQCLNAQRLLVDEKFATERWQNEFAALNAGYSVSVASLGNAIDNNATTALTSTALYFGKYALKGDVEFIRCIPPRSTVSISGGSFNCNPNVPLGFRLNNANNGYLELPELPSVDTVFFNLRCGNTTANGTLYFQKWENDVWTTIQTITIQPRGNFFDTNVDELIACPVNSKTPVKLRLLSGNRFTNIYRFRVQEHIQYSLQAAIDSANVIKTAAVVGTSPEEFPQAAYNDFSAAIPAANTIFENENATHEELYAAFQTLNVAIADFYATKIPPTAVATLIDETFVSEAWQAEFLALNPTYILPAIPTGIDVVTVFNTLNSTDLYFGKYRLNGDIELICASNAARPRSVVSISGGNFNIADGTPFGFRFKNDGTSWVELPEVSSVSDILLNIRCGNEMFSSNLTVEKWENDAWTAINTFSVQGKNNYYENFVDELVRVPVNSPTPIKMRIKGANTRYADLYRFRILEHSAPITTNVNNSNKPKLQHFGRTIVMPTATCISIYNVAGQIVYQKENVQTVEIPQSVGNGIFILKSENNVWKIKLLN